MDPLYKLTSDYQQLAKLAADCTDPADAQVFTDTLEGLGGEIDQKVLSCAAVVKSLEAQQTAVDVEKKRLAARSTSIGNAIDRIKSSMQDAMAAASLDKVKGDLFTVSLQLNPPKVKVSDETKIPAAFKQVVTTPMLSEIKESLKLGVEIPGACLEQTRGIRIR